MSSSSSSAVPSFDGDGDGDGESFFYPVQPHPHRNAYGLNNKIMLTAIVSLSLVVILVIALHIYARYALRRQARRRNLMRRLGIIALIDAHDPPPRRSGLDPVVMASLPVVVFKLPENQDPAGAAVECAVCLSAVEDGETARILPNCKHIFHSECIDKWFGSHSTCPICRTEAAPRPQPEPREAPAGGSAPAPVVEAVNGSGSRLSSFRRMLSRERSSRRIQHCVQENGNDDVQDLERQ